MTVDAKSKVMPISQIVAAIEQAVITRKTGEPKIKTGSSTSSPPIETSAANGLPRTKYFQNRTRKASNADRLRKSLIGQDVL